MTPPPSLLEESSSQFTITTPLTIRTLKQQADYLYENAPQDDPTFTTTLDKFVRGSLIQGTELLQTMRDLKRTKLAEEICQQQKAYSNRPLQTGGVLPVSEGHVMMKHFKENKRVKTEALIKHLDEKLHKQHEKWYFEAAKKAWNW